MFLDLVKAYDRVPQGFVWGLLWEYGVDSLLLQDIESLFCRSQSLVCISSTKSNPFQVRIGLGKKPPIVNVLVIIFMDRIARRSQVSEGVKFDGLQIPSLLFVNDVVLLG